MTREVIYVPLGGGPGDRGALEAAKGLAVVYDAELELVFVGVDDASVLLVAGDGYGGLGAVAVEALQEERTRSEAAARDMAAAFGLPIDTHRGPRIGATAAARLAALAVVDDDSARGRGPLTDVFEALLLVDGAPVLAPRRPPPYASVAIAWDGSREAARALRAAAPLLAAAERVSVLQASGAVDVKDARAADPERLKAWIGRHSSARVDAVALDGDPVRSLEPAIRSVAADLVVAGAYGHARLREAVFGGATKSLLAADTPSLLFAH